MIGINLLVIGFDDDDLSIYRRLFLVRVDGVRFRLWLLIGLNYYIDWLRIIGNEFLIFIIFF